MTPIAIIGMSALMPGARDLREYWDNIVNARDCITDVPESRWSIDDFYDPDPAAADRTYCRRGGFIPDIDFDPLEWGLPPNILEVTDVAQLLGLVLAKRAFDDAGYGADRAFARERTGVILGVGGGQKLITPLTARLQEPVWRRALESTGIAAEQADLIVDKIKGAYVRWEENSFPGMLGNVIAGRIANRFDLGGINCVVDAACAASLAALRMAVAELTDRRCDMMLTGGIDADNSPFMYLCFSKTPAFTRGEHCRPFDASSGGMMVGEGLGMLVLKRLEDAERAGDRIYAVIRGIGASSDGRFKSIYAPRSEGQARALQRAYDVAGVEPASIGLIEAHGTGTIAGDLCEVETLRSVFGDGVAPHTVALGSVKSQIGHTKAAAGAAGMIKTALALHHGILPPTINIDAPHPSLQLDGSPFYLNTAARAWVARAGEPRRAAVSSFGFGGTNFHVVLEEHGAKPPGAYRLHRTAREVLLSAASVDALARECASAASLLRGEDADAQLSALARQVAMKAVPPRAPRIGLLADDAARAAELLEHAAARLAQQPGAEHWDDPRGLWYRQAALGGKVAALFPGQGSQFLHMGNSLFMNFPPTRSLLADVDALFIVAGERPLSETMLPVPALDAAAVAAQEERLRATARAQPGIGVVSAGIFELLRAAGFQPDIAGGHSFGELTALWAAGSVNTPDFARLMCARGHAMAPTQQTSDAGAMIAVTGASDEVLQAAGAFADLRVANFNAPDQVVLAGPTPVVQAAGRALEAAGFRTTMLPVSAAFHTPLVAHAHAPFAEEVAATSFRTPGVPVYGNATGAPYPADPAKISERLAAQMLEPVRFVEQIEAMYAAGARLFVEVGPRAVLTGLVGRILGARPHAAVAVNKGGRDADRELREAVVRLRVLGVVLGALDPFELPAQHNERQRSAGRTVLLNGANYVSEKTRNAYQTMLAREFVAAPAQHGPIEHEEMTTVNHNGASAPLVMAAEPASSHPTAAHFSIDEGMQQLFAHQRQVIELQQQFLQHQTEVARLMVQHGHSNAALLERLSALQSETMRLHDRFMARQTRYALSLLGTLERQAGMPTNGAIAPAPRVVAAPVTVAPTVIVTPVSIAAPAVDAARLDLLAQAMLETVSEKTGYPVESLELGMDMEADLGIDSIKRVEILGAMQERFTDLPPLKPELLAELRTLAQVVEHMRSHAGEQGTTPPRPTVANAIAAGLAVTTPRLRSLPAPDTLHVPLGTNRTLVLSSDGSATTAEVAHRLGALGWRVVVLEFPGTHVPARAALPPSLPHISLHDLDDGRVGDAFAAIAQQHGAIGAFVHLHPHRNGSLTINAEDGLLRQVFLAARYLKQPLEESARQGRGSFVTVMRLDGALGTTGRQSDPAAGALFGLVKTMRQEWPQVFCRAIDVAPEMTAQQTAHIVVGELLDPDERLVEVAHGPHGRVTLVADHEMTAYARA